MKTISFSKNTTWAAISAICLASFAVGAHANAPQSPVPVRTVHYADLDLSTQQGTDALYRRIRSAAQAVCGDESSRQLAEAAAAKICIKQAVGASVGTVNNSRLTHTYDVQFGVAPTTVSVASLR